MNTTGSILEKEKNAWTETGIGKIKTSSSKICAERAADPFMGVDSMPISSTGDLEFYFRHNGQDLWLELPFLQNIGISLIVSAFALYAR